MLRVQIGLRLRENENIWISGDYPLNIMDETKGDMIWGIKKRDFAEAKAGEHSVWVCGKQAGRMLSGTSPKRERCSFSFRNSALTNHVL